MITQFADRAEAGRFLATKLERFNGADTVVYALPRGGVSVGVEIAETLGIPIDVTFADRVCEPWGTSAGPKREGAHCELSRPILPAGRVAIVVDDGLASGVRLQTVVKALRWQGAKAIVVAQPVASRSALKDFETLVDDVICVDLADNGDERAPYVRESHVNENGRKDARRLTAH